PLCPAEYVGPELLVDDREVGPALDQVPQGVQVPGSGGQVGRRRATRRTLVDPEAQVGELWDEFPALSRGGLGEEGGSFGGSEVAGQRRCERVVGVYAAIEVAD